MAAKDRANTIDTNRIVVGIDGSVAAAAALRWAVELAARRHSPLVIAHAVPDVAEPNLDLLQGMMVGASMLVLGVDNSRVTPSEESIACRLMDEAACPVVLVPAGFDAIPIRDARLARVVAVICANEPERKVLHIAAAEACARQLPLVVIASTADRTSADWAEQPTVSFEVSRLLAEVGLNYPDLYFELKIVKGTTVAGLLQATGCEAHLLIIGAPHRTLGTPSSSTVNLLRQVSCPVVVVDATSVTDVQLCPPLPAAPSRGPNPYRHMSSSNIPFRRLSWSL